MGMHGLINRALECFVRDTYGTARWAEVTRRAGLGFDGFEAMFSYDPALTSAVLEAMGRVLDRPVEEILEDVGTYLVSHPNTESLRRLLRFGGVTFTEFLHSLDELPERAALAVDDLDLPRIEVADLSDTLFELSIARGRFGFGHVLTGILRAMADDYGALVMLDHRGTRGDAEVIAVSVIEAAFAEGREFDLGARAG